MDLLIMARTDARIIAFEEALIRCKAFKEVGADAIVVDALESVEELQTLCREIPGSNLCKFT